jgi:Uma2 family endonuclease
MAGMAKRRQDFRMTVDEFLVWDDGTDTRYELDRGVPVAMAPPATPHARISANVTIEIDRHLAGREPCRAMQGAGVVVSRADESFYVPDVLMTCEPPADTPYVEAPHLIVEILSPSTKGIDQASKVPAYAALPTVEEIWLVDGERRGVLVWRRSEGSWLATIPYTGSQAFPSPVLEGEIELDRLYKLTGL